MADYGDDLIGRIDRDARGEHKSMWNDDERILHFEFPGVNFVCTR